MAPLLETKGLSRRFGGLTAVDSVDLRVGARELVSIIGPNGAGKTTLFNLVTGLDAPDAGTVTLDGRDITRWPAEKLARHGVARTFQHGRVFGNLSVLDNVLVGAHTRLDAARSGLPLLGPIAELLRGLVRGPAVAREEKRLREEVAEVLSLFGERLLPRLDHPAHSLSYANRRRVEIARAIMLRPTILFLDEPTAGMNETETNEMLEVIEGLKGRGLTMVLIEHKLDMVMRLSDRVVVLDNGAKIAEGAPTAVRNDPKVIEAYLGSGSVGAKAAPAGATTANRDRIEPDSGQPDDPARSGPEAHDNEALLRVAFGGHGL